MFEPARLALFAAATAALALTPGPNMAYMLSRAVSQGRRAGALALLGVEAGFLTHLVAAAFGLSAVLLAVPVAYDAMRLAGAAYLGYLAWRTVRGAHDLTAAARGGLPPDSAGKLLRMGFVSNALNPKTAVFYLSIFPQFVDPARGSVLAQSVALGLLHVAVSTACNLAFILGAGALARGLVRRPQWQRVQRWLFGTLLGAFALRLVLDRRRPLHAAR